MEIINLLLGIILMQIYQVNSFTFRSITADPLVYTISQITSYTLTYDRTTLNGAMTAFNTIPVPSNGTIVVTFPADYTLDANYSCSSVTIDSQTVTGANCTRSGNTITITNAFTNISNLFVRTVIVVINNIKNPSPAKTTAQFTGSLGSDIAQAVNNGVTLTAGAFTSCSVTFNPNTVNSTSTMIVNVDPNTAIPSNGYIVVTLPVIWANDISTTNFLPVSPTMNCINRTANLLSSITCRGSGLGFSYIVTVQSLFANTTSDVFEFGINNFLSPPTPQPSDFIKITSYIGLYQIDTCTTTVTNLQPKSLRTLTFKSTIQPMIVSSLVGLQINMTLADTVNQLDTFKITFPSEISLTYVDIFVSSTPNKPPTLNNRTLIITQTASPRTFVDGGTIFITFLNITAPPSIKISNLITVQIQKNGFTKQIGTGTITASPGALTVSIQPTITRVSTNTSYKINITSVYPITSTGKLKIYFPTQLIISINSTSCATLIGTNVSNTPVCNVNLVQNSITFTSLNSSNATIPAQNFQFTINGIINAPSSQPTSSFLVQLYYTNTDDTLVANGVKNNISAQPGTININNVFITASSYIVYEFGVYYTLSFVNTYQIPIGGIINMKIPPDIIFSTTNIGTYCQFTTNSGTFRSTSCVDNGSNSTQYSINFTAIASDLIPPGTNISLRIISIITNPSSTRIVSSFGISTSSNGYLIQELNTGLTIRMQTPAQFNSTSVSRINQTNSLVTSYTIRLQQRADLETNAILKVTFPSVIVLPNSPSCTDFSGFNLSCSQNNNILTIFLTNTSGMLNFSTIVAGVLNPPSYKPLTANFTFQTKSADNISSYCLTSRLFNLSNNAPSSFSLLNYTFSPRTLASPTSLTIKVTPSSFIVPTSIVVSIPGSFSVPVNLTCGSIVGFNGTCQFVSTNTIRVTGTLIGSQMTFTISGIESPINQSSQPISIISYDDGGFKIDQNLTYIQFSIICTLPCKTCSSNLTSCLSCYNSTIRSEIYLYQTNNSCLQSCPPTTYAQNIQFKCLSCGNFCQNCIGLATNCTSCKANSSYPYFYTVSNIGNCSATCPDLQYPDTTSTPILCKACQSPCGKCNNLTSCITCVAPYYLNLTCIMLCPGGTTIPNNTTRECQKCDLICLTCSIIITNCTSCSFGYFMQNQTCVNTCTPPQVVNNGSCGSCDPICKTCSIISSNCTSCENNSTNRTYLFNRTCITNCLATYYPDNINAVCVICTSVANFHCDECTASNVCTKCSTNYILYNSTCLTQAPPGFVNQSNVAVPCSVSLNCATCSIIPTNCTSCINLNLEGNTCVQNCSITLVAQNKICVPCQYPCEQCQSLKNNCTTCAPNSSLYLLNNNCVPTCPNQTYQNPLNNQCNNCTSPCLLCDSLLICISCRANFFLSGSKCNATCNFGFVGINRQCVPCDPPCASCSNTTINCLTCVTNYFFLNTTQTCVQNCPIGLYPNNVTGQCSGCSSPCDTCINTSSTCLTCLNNRNLFNNTCVVTCPNGTYLTNFVCQNCTNGCDICVSANNCSSCKVTHHLYLNFCVIDCPLTHPYIALNGSCIPIPCTKAQCITCISYENCSQCNFPYLLLFGQCFDKCPTDYESNLTNCIYNPLNTTNNTNNTTDQILNQTLSTPNLFPVPFTIGATFLGVACIMSKFQNSGTFMPGSLYSLWSLLQWGAFMIAALLTYLQIGIGSTQFYILLGSIGLFYILNVLALPIQNCYLRQDSLFSRWNSYPPYMFFYILISILGLFCTHKVKNIMFCKLFNFGICKAQLQDVQNFRIFNIFSFLSFISSAGIIFSIILLIIGDKTINQKLMAYIDVLVLTTIMIILAILNALKDVHFFQQTNEDGYTFNKRIEESQQFFKQAIMPPYQEDQQMQCNFNSDRKFQAFTTLKGVNQQIFSNSQTSSIRSQDFVKNVSLQVDQLIQSQFPTPPPQEQRPFDESIITHLDYQGSIPSFSFFSKKQKSIQMSRKNVDKSIDQTKKVDNSISIQNAPLYNQVSIQHHQISNHDISLQHVPNINNQYAQINAQVREHSVQYSAKPIFQHISEDFGNQTSQYMDDTVNRTRMPAKQQEGLRQQLQLDIDEKLQKRQQELNRLRQQNRQMQINLHAKNFQKQPKQRLLRPRDQYGRFGNEPNRQKINEMYNNNSSIKEEDSLMDSQVDILKNMNKKKRIQSAKSEQEFIQMLKRQNNDLQLDGSLSFNVSRDMQGHHPENKNQKKVQQPPPEKQKFKDNPKDKKGNIIFQIEQKQIPSDEDGNTQQITNQQQLANIMKQDTSSQFLPSYFDKSNSTNFRTTVRNQRNRPPLPPKSSQQYENGYDIDQSHRQEEQQIINHPIRPSTKRQNLPRSKYRQQQLNFGDRTNLNQFVNRQSRNLASAQIYQSKYIDEDKLEKKNSEQMPLPQTKKLKTQNDSQQKITRMNSKRLLLNNVPKNIQFEDNERIESQQDNEYRGGIKHERRLPRLTKSEKKFKQSTSKNQKPLHKQLLKTGSRNDFEKMNKYLQKQQKKAQKSKQALQQIQYMLERPSKVKQSNKRYLKNTYASEQKMKSLEKVYLNKLKKYE